MGRIDEAFVVCTPPSTRQLPYNLKHGDIDFIVNDHIKGWYLLAKELTAYFKAAQGGALALALLEASSPRDAPADLTGPAVGASFKAFAQAVLTASAAEPYQVMGFTSSEVGEEASFAAYIFKVIEETNRRNSGKWYKHGRLGLFGR
jgi:hypothetical protein